MDFCILGPLEVLDDGRAVAVGGARQRALLALLVIHANEALGTERLIDELWGERPPASATKTLQVYISRLRKVLGPCGPGGHREMLVTRHDGYELQIDPEQIDSYRFEQLIAAGRRELVAGRPERAVSLLEEALSVWRGPPLAEFSYETLAQAEIARLDELRVGAHEELVEAKLALGRHAEAVAPLEGLIHEHPYRERLRAQLMLALYRCDRQADALQAYQNARRTLVEELGIEPGQRLRELEAGILAQDRSLAIAGRPRAAEDEPIAETSGGVFVGRRAELAELLVGLDDAFAGHGRLFLLVGEPGVGKSRLAGELMRSARARGARLLIGRCWEAGGAPAFWPWRQSLRWYLRASDRQDLAGQLGPGAPDIATIVPELHDLIRELAPRTAPDSEGARFRLFQATAEFLRRASEAGPLVMVLDDLHAADTPSLLMLQFIARELGSMRVLVIAAMRDVDPLPGERLTALTAEVAREPVTRRISLGGLSEGDVAEYVQLTAAEIASDELAVALHAETEGNPLFIAEVVRLLSLEGVQREPGRGVRLIIPQSVRDVISRRLAHLRPDCQQILALASVLGREFGLESLARVADVSVDMVLDTLDEAMAARVIDEIPGADGRLRFGHVLMRDTLYEGLTLARRVRMHRLAVNALAALYDDDPAHLAELAHHAIAGRDFERAVRYGWRAGDRALALLAYEEAVRLYQTALDALERAPVVDERSRCELLLSLGEAQGRAGDTPAAKAAFVQAADIARRLGRPRELARAAVGYGGRTAWMRVAGDGRLVPLLEEGLDAVEADDVELRARLLARLAGALRDEPSRDRRDRLSWAAVELARRSGSAAALAYALDGRTEVILAPDTVAECLALGDELCDVAQRIGDKERMVHGHMDRFVVRVLLGDIQAARTDLAAMSQIAEELRQPVQLWQASIAQAMLALGLGMLPQAEELIAGALALGERPHPQMAIPAHRVQWCTLCELRGEPGRAVSSIRDLVADYPSRPVFGCVLAHLQARLGQTTEARRALQELAGQPLPFDQEWLYGMTLLAETAAMVHDSDAAIVLYQLLKPWERFNAADHPEGMRGSVSRYLGLLAATLERPDQAAAHYEAALAMNTRMGARPWLAHTQNDYAQVLSDRGSPGDRQRAYQLRETARSTCRELGISLHAATTPAAQHEIKAG